MRHCLRQGDVAGAAEAIASDPSDAGNRAVLPAGHRYYNRTYSVNLASRRCQLLCATIAVGVAILQFVVVVIVLVDRVCRKLLLYISTIGITACLAVLAALQSLLARGALPSGIAIIRLTLCGFVAFFSVGIGPIKMVLSSEIYLLPLRTCNDGNPLRPKPDGQPRPRPCRSSLSTAL